MPRTNNRFIKPDVLGIFHMIVRRQNIEDDGSLLVINFGSNFNVVITTSNVITSLYVLPII